MRLRVLPYYERAKSSRRAFRNFKVPRLESSKDHYISLPASSSKGTSPTSQTETNAPSSAGMFGVGLEVSKLSIARISSEIPMNITSKNLKYI